MDKLTIEVAITLAQKVLTAAQEATATVAVVVVDATGGPVLSVRPPGLAPLIERAARRKAAAAAAFGQTTSALSELFGADPLLVRAFSGSDDVLVLPGGFPLHRPDGIIGAVGIAGGHYSADQAIGESALGR